MTEIERPKSKPYVPDLAQMASVCEANYLRLLKLLPDMDNGTGRRFSIDGGPHHSTKIEFIIEEQFKYTLTIIAKQTTGLSSYLTAPKIEVRLYHDVRMAEVISFHNEHKFNGSYHYPNPQMRLPDEKMQINHFLSEWLHHCLTHGETDLSLNYHPDSLKM